MRPARHYAAVVASAVVSSALGTVATTALKFAPTVQQIAPYLIFAVLAGGLFMYVRCEGAKAREVGRLLMIAAILALLIAIAPFTVRLTTRS